jgi:hypothetical protein
MKKIVVLLLLCLSAHASADTAAWMPNNGGGKIVLTDKDCPDDARQYMAYTTSNTISTQFGCWFSDDLMVHITWSSTGSFKSYPLENWTLNSEVIRRMKNRLNKSSGKGSI